MKYLMLYKHFNGAFWLSSHMEFDTISKLKDYIYQNDNVKDIRIFEINREIKITRTMLLEVL